MMLWLLAFLLGVIYGFVNPGRENRWNIIKKSLGIGVFLGIILGLIFAILLPPAGIFLAGFTVIGVVLFVLYFTVLFVLGTIVGDILESLIR